MPSNENVIKIEFFNEDGTLKDKSTFEKEMDALYEEISHEAHHVRNEDTLMGLLAPDGEFDPLNIIEKYQFLERKLYLDTEITEETGRHFLERI